MSDKNETTDPIHNSESTEKNDSVAETNNDDDIPYCVYGTETEDDVKKGAKIITEIDVLNDLEFEYKFKDGSNLKVKVEDNNVIGYIWQKFEDINNMLKLREQGKGVILKKKGKEVPKVVYAWDL